MNFKRIVLMLLVTGLFYALFNNVNDTSHKVRFEELATIDVKGVTPFSETIKQEIINEVAQNVKDGKLPSFHNKYSDWEPYQTYYNKVVRTSNSLESLEHFASLSEDDIVRVISMYFTIMNDVWTNIFRNIDIDIKYLEPNRILGLYWHKHSDKTNYLYLIWTSRYLPTDLMSVNEMIINGAAHSKHPRGQEKTIDNQIWLDSDFSHAADGLSIFLTPIAGFENGKQFGVPLTRKYTFTHIKAGLSQASYGYNADPTGIFDVEINHQVTFDLGAVPKLNSRSVFQLVTHAYELIQDCEVQSYFDILFGGYIHQVVFNTTIPMDKIYRTDVAYTLSSENKDWYQFWLNTKEREVVKSLNAERKGGGLFNLFKYQGLEEGTFKSNVKGSKVYQYRLHLNYDETGWNLFDRPINNEANYKVIKNFKIFRMNYLADNEVYDVYIKMDTVDGETLNIFDRELIMDSDSTFWKIKEGVNDFLDELKERFGKAGSVLASVLATVGLVIILYFSYKVIIFILPLFKGNKERSVPK